MTNEEAPSRQDENGRDPIRRHFDLLAPRWNSIAVHPEERIRHVLSSLGNLSGAHMLEEAAAAHGAPNLAFVPADFHEFRSTLGYILVTAYSCYPHFREPEAFWQSVAANLVPGGQVLVAHIEGREAINAMHAERASTISRRLEPVAELARVAARFGIEAVRTEDGGGYFVFQGKRARQKRHSADSAFENASQDRSLRTGPLVSPFPTSALSPPTSSWRPRTQVPPPCTNP